MTDISSPATPGDGAGTQGSMAGLSRIRSLLNRKPPQIDQAIKELKVGLLGGYPDPLDPGLPHLADEIAAKIGDESDQLKFWRNADSFVAGELADAYPGVNFSRGHALFRIALIRIRQADGYKDAVAYLARARTEDEARGLVGMQSAADCWYRLFCDYEDLPAYLGAIDAADREKFFDNVNYAWDRAVKGSAGDPRAQQTIVALASLARPNDGEDLARLGLLRYRDLVAASREDAVVSAIASVGFLAEFCADALLRSEGVTDHALKRQCCKTEERKPLEELQLRQLVLATEVHVNAIRRIVISLLRFVLHIRNRLHLGNELRKKERLDFGVVRILPHIADRLLINTLQSMEEQKPPTH